MWQAVYIEYPNNSLLVAFGKNTFQQLASKIKFISYPLDLSRLTLYFILIHRIWQKMALYYHFSYIISHFCHWSWPNLGRETLHVFFLPCTPENTIWTNLKWSPCSWGKQPSWGNTMKAIPSDPPANNKYTSEPNPDQPRSAWTSLHSQVIDSWGIINGDCFKSLSFGAICYRVIVN